MVTEEKKTLRFIIAIDVTTNKSIEDVKKGLNKGIYRGLDTEPNYIAPPKDVFIDYIKCTDYGNKYE
jgi:hypothetical protein